MGSIQQLPEQLINQIAAGEVVERPASAVKELLENSLDAGAKKIIIEVNGGGDNFLRITDDGCGMDSADAVLAFEPHATSKISTTEDLFNIRTLGFRGEAVASIASVSYITLQTKKRGEMEGTLVMAEGGKITKIQPVGVPEGTQIEIQNLFYNTPARKKYLKNDSTEYQHIMDVVTSIALTFPKVSFRVVHDGKLVFDLPAVEDEITRINSLFGKNITDELIPVFYGHSQIQLKGFIGKPLIARSNRNLQYLFVNHREVKSSVLGYAVKQSYTSLLPKEKYPVFFLYFEIDPQLVDVNVHPRKLEVRFRDEREIFSATSSACKKALETYVLAPNITHDEPVNYYTERKPQPLKLEDKAVETLTETDLSKAQDLESHQVVVSEQAVGGVQAVEEKIPVAVASSAPVENLAAVEAVAEVQTVASPAEKIFQQTMDFTAEQSSNEQNAPEKNADGNPVPVQNIVGQERKNLEPMMALAQLNNSYILCQQGSSLVIVDQHAAHERIRYTQIFAEFEEKKLVSQTLAVPLQVELSPREIAVFETYKDFFANLAFEIEPFGGKTFSIHAVPSHLSHRGEKDPEKVFLGLLDEFAEGKHATMEEQTSKALTYLACRSAVKFGDPLGREEQVALIEKLQTMDQPYTCPHGRPSMIVMSADELKKRFGRDYSA